VGVAVVALFLPMQGAVVARVDCFKPLALLLPLGLLSQLL
jgi:hypothetical protein